MVLFVCALSITLFLALMLSLALQPKIIKRITGGLLLFTGISGIFLYGYGYTKLFGNVLHAVIRTLFSVFCMFLGRNEISAISTVPLLSGSLMQFYIYTVHLLALYCTASAIISTLGSRLILSFRLLLLRHRNLHLIYGMSAETISFAEKLRKEKKGLIAFVNTGMGNIFDADILRLGASIIDADDTKTPTAAFLRKIGMRPGKRKMTLYCLDDEANNLRFAEAIRQALDAASVSPEQTSLTILLADEGKGALLQNCASRYGYGSVAAYERAALLTRLMVYTWPPYKTVRFDDNACAAEDFEALIVGFGATGQAALRSMIMNGQYEHSCFRVAVFSEDRCQRAGSFFAKYASVEQHYDIRFYDLNVRSIEAIKLIKNRFTHLNYVVVCTGDEKENAEIAMELTTLLSGPGTPPPIVMLGKKEASRISEDGIVETVSLFSPEILCTDQLDRLAMLINHKYHEKDDRSVREDWADCDYFSRISCRATADYADAFLYAAKTNREEIRSNYFTASDTIIESLSRMEHLRWCAFHYVMGYQTMPPEELAARIAAYRMQKNETGKATIRIGKDTEKKYHACLIPWEDLPALSEKESAATGERVDYRQKDRDNVLMILDTLKTYDNAGELNL